MKPAFPSPSASFFGFNLSIREGFLWTSSAVELVTFDGWLPSERCENSPSLPGALLEPVMPPPVAWCVSDETLLDRPAAPTPAPAAPTPAVLWSSSMLEPVGRPPECTPGVSAAPVVPDMALRWLAPVTPAEEVLPTPWLPVRPDPVWSLPWWWAAAAPVAPARPAPVAAPPRPLERRPSSLLELLLRRR